MQPQFMVIVPQHFMQAGVAQSFKVLLDSIAISPSFKEHVKKISLLSLDEAYVTKEGVTFLRIK